MYLYILYFQLEIGERWDQLIRGVLAGNIFDWGAKAVADMLENGAIDFEIALSKLQGESTKYTIFMVHSCDVDCCSCCWSYTLFECL